VHVVVLVQVEQYGIFEHGFGDTVGPAVGAAPAVLAGGAAAVVAGGAAAVVAGGAAAVVAGGAAAVLAGGAAAVLAGRAAVEGGAAGWAVVVVFRTQVFEPFTNMKPD